MDIYLGIDFGAENIMVSYKTKKDDTIKMVYFNDKPYIKNYYALANNKQEYFGQEAQDIYLDSLDENNNILFISKYKQDLVKSTSSIDKEKYKSLSPQKVMIKMLRYVKKEFEKKFELEENTTVNIISSVITIPILWKLDATVIQMYKLAMQEVGFKNFRIEAEPVAAAANVITLTRDKYKLFGLQNAPQSGDNILLIDIGASTLDVNLCKYENPIKTIVGEGNEYAGNYLDALLCHYKESIDLEELLKFSNTYFEDIHDIKRLKEDSRGLHRFAKRNPADGANITKASKQYIEEITNSIVEIITNNFEESIEYFVICGGMSQYNYDDFLKNFALSLKEKLPKRLKNTIFFNNYSEFNNDFLHKTIVNGAAMLAADPKLVTKNLPYHVGMIVNTKIRGEIEQQRKRHPIVLLQKGIPLKETSQKYSLRENLLKHGHIKNESDKLTTENFEKIKVFLANTEKDLEKFVLENKETQNMKLEIKHGYKNKKDIEQISVDALCYIDKDGIVNIDIVDIHNDNEIIANGKFEKFTDVEQSLEVRI